MIHVSYSEPEIQHRKSMNPFVVKSHWINKVDTQLNEFSVARTVINLDAIEKVIHSKTAKSIQPVGMHKNFNNVP